MISTIIRVASVILLIIIFTNMWSQKKQREEQQKKIEHKKIEHKKNNK